MDKIIKLKSILKNISVFESARELLYWDQATHMPVGAARSRGEQIASLDKYIHSLFTSDEVGELLEDLKSVQQQMAEDSDDYCLLHHLSRLYKRKRAVPADFVSKFSKHTSSTYNAWVKARSENDFDMMVPYLEQTLEYSRQWGSFFSGYDHVIDPHIDYHDEGLTYAEVNGLFAKLREELLPLANAVCDQTEVDNRCLGQYYPAKHQLEFSRTVLKKVGFDFKRGSLDISPHPFMINIACGDIRLTTRIEENRLDECLFSALHEAGHGMYGQGINRKLALTPLDRGVSSGMHESQSRLWENLVGRSFEFWRYFYPQLKKMFAGQLADVSLEQFYRAINKVQKSLIRTDADELTYNLHVILRFDLEVQLLEGALAVSDLADAWNARYESDLGVVPGSHAEGVLQDGHWFDGRIGGEFHGYAVGDIASAQIYRAAVEANSDIPEMIARGNFKVLHQWLVDNIYSHGSKYPPDKLLKRATGKSLEIDDYINYLRRKYSEIYTGLNL